MSLGFGVPSSKFLKASLHCLLIGMAIVTASGFRIALRVQSKLQGTPLQALNRRTLLLVLLAKGAITTGTVPSKFQNRPKKRKTHVARGGSASTASTAQQLDCTFGRGSKECIIVTDQQRSSLQLCHRPYPANSRRFCHVLLMLSATRGSVIQRIQSVRAL